MKPSLIFSFLFVFLISHKVIFGQPINLKPPLLFQKTITDKKKDTCRIVFGWRTSEAHSPLLDWMIKGGYTWGVELLHDVPVSTISELQAKGLNIILYQLSHPETVQRYYTQKNRTIPDVDLTVNQFKKATSGKFVWQHILEDESCGVGLAQEFLSMKPATHREAYEMTEKYFRKSIQASQNQDKIPHWAVAGFANTAHILAKQPEIALLSIERANDDVDDLQTGVSFFRGAARQYGKMWGVDLSLWWGAINGCIQNLPHLYHKRHLYISWFSGAEHFRIEGSELFFDKSNAQPTAFVKCMDDFGKFIKTHERGVPDVPVAIILPEDHGWITPPYWQTKNTVWNYANIPYRQGQKALDGFFSLAFPGSNFYMDPFPFGKYKSENSPISSFALSSISKEFAPSPENVYHAEYPVNFGQYDYKNHAQKILEMNQIETSNHRPMGNSRWGDIFDIFTTEVDKSTLDAYKVIVLFDQIKLDGSMMQKLQHAMENGATVICAAGVLTPEHTNFIGSEIEPVLRVGEAWSLNNNKMVNEPFRYFRSRLTKNAKSLATTSSGHPLIIEKKYGKGKLISFMIPWFEGATLDISNAALQLFDKVISEIQPVKIEGLPVEFLITKSDRFVNVVISNNSDQVWNGKIMARSVSSQFSKCKELITSKKLNFIRKKDGFSEVEVIVPPFEISVISWSK